MLQQCTGLFVGENSDILARIQAMADKFNACIAKVKEAQDDELHDLCARHLYEMAGDVVMSLLLLQDAAKAPDLFGKSLLVYVNLAEADVEKHNRWVGQMTIEQLENYRQA